MSSTCGSAHIWLRCQVREQLRTSLPSLHVYRILSICSGVKTGMRLSDWPRCGRTSRAHASVQAPQLAQRNHERALTGLVHEPTLGSAQSDSRIRAKKRTSLNGVPSFGNA